MIAAGADIGQNVRVRKSSRVEAGARIGGNARIRRDVRVGASATIGASARSGAGAIIIAGAVIPEGTSIARGATFGGGGSEVCDDGSDTDGNGLMDCEEAVCISHPTCGSEVCTDTIDNDGDGLNDCVDDECIAEVQGQLTVTHLSNVIDIDNSRVPRTRCVTDHGGSRGSSGHPDRLLDGARRSRERRQLGHCLSTDSCGCAGHWPRAPEVARPFQLSRLPPERDLRGRCLPRVERCRPACEPRGCHD
ncbi:MAG: hypothetical protein ACJAZO_001695 [Myxococcota bacterium]